jgi:hypothetical protein
MAVHYEVPIGKTFVVSGPANVRVTGGESPLIVDDVTEFQDAAPTITSIAPDTAEAGSPDDITMIVTGTDLSANTIIVFADQDERTTFNADGTVSTIVKPSIFVSPDTVPVAVRNGPARSAAVDFTFTDPAGAARTSKKKKADG